MIGNTKDIAAKVTVHNPSVQNVKDASDVTFTPSTFMLPAPGSDDAGIDASPRKKRKVDMESRWQDAVIRMNKYRSGDEEEDDESLSGTSPTRKRSPMVQKVKHRPSSPDISLDDMDIEVADDWSPPEADPSLEIPNELVFARDKPTGVSFWPAKIEYYKAPTKPKEKPRYGVLFLDGARRAIPRSWFFTSDDDEFGQCKVILH